MGEEAAMIRRAIRARHAGLPTAEMEAALQPVGFVTQDLIHRMAAAQTMDDLVSLFHETPFGLSLSAALDAYHEVGVPFPLESALDRMLFEELESAVMLVDASHLLPVTGYVGAHADNTNVKILLRARRDRLPPDRVAGFLVGPGTLIPQAALRKMAEAPSVEEIIALLEGTGMRDAVVPAEAEYRRTGRLSAFEKALDEFLLARLADLATVHRYGPGPLISFLVARKFEVQNLRAIVWGVRAGMEREEIAQLLVCGQVSG
jgi:V/A-type H+-transporting ATPase subunit C